MAAKPQLIERVRAFIESLQNSEPTTGILVALSAGQDSCALLHSLAELRSECSLSLSAAHVNHGLRAGEADSDQSFAEQFAESLGVPIESAKRDVKGFAKRGRLSIQEAARELRRDFLLEAADRACAPLIALGHTQDDHIETVLLNLVRGTGVDGLRGLPARSGRFIRPLREVTRKETEEYCRLYGIGFRVDRSNLDRKYLRNRVREELLPNLAAYYNPAIRDALLRLSESAAADSDFLRIVAESEQSAVSIRSSNDSISLELAALNALHPAIRRRVVRLAIETVKGNLANVDFQAVESAVLASAKGLRFGWTIPGTQVRILCDGKSLTILRAEAAASPLPFEMVLNVSGTTEIPDGMIAAEELTDVNSADFAGPDCCVLDADAIQGMIRVRNRRPGDRIQPLGMSGTKKVQDILADAKIPADQRDRIPILSDDAGPLWVAGHRISERVKVTAKTRRILRIRYEKDPDTGSE